MRNRAALLGYLESRWAPGTLHMQTNVYTFFYIHMFFFRSLTVVSRSCKFIQTHLLNSLKLRFSNAQASQISVAPGSRTSAAPTLDADFAGSSELELKTKNRKYDGSNISESVATDLIMILTMILMMMMMIIIIIIIIILIPFGIFRCHLSESVGVTTVIVIVTTSQPWPPFLMKPGNSCLPPPSLPKMGLVSSASKIFKKCEKMSLLCSWAVTSNKFQSGDVDRNSSCRV